MNIDGDMIEQVDPSDGELQKVDFIGSGVLIFHRDHVLALKRPWFSDQIIDNESWERAANMDSWFVWRLKTEAFADCWVDTTIKVRHLHIFAIDESFSEEPNVPTPGTTGSHSEEPGLVADEVLQAV